MPSGKKLSGRTEPRSEVKIVTMAISAWADAFVWRRFLIAAVALIALLGVLAGYNQAYASRVYPGVQLGAVSLGGLSAEAAEAALRATWYQLADTGIPLVINERQVVLEPIVTSATDPDLTYELIRFDPQVAAEAAYTIGRSGNWFQNLLVPVGVRLALVPQPDSPAELELARVLQFIRDSLPGLEQTPQAARLEVDLASNISVRPEAGGMIINAEQLQSDLLDRLGALSAEPIAVEFIEVNPSLTQAKLAPLVAQAKSLLREQSLSFSWEGQVWVVEPVTWYQWLGAREESGEVSLGLLEESADEFLTQLETVVNQAARDASFNLTDGRVTVFLGSRPGRILDRTATLLVAFERLQSVEADPVALVVETTEPSVTTAEVNDLGISELIGVGRSNFKGSPKNRRHNIQVGANSLNGLLIKPDEEFSLLKALGTIDGTTGYLQELVIKGNRTIPEFGGGLCQIGTTTFRAALASGLPITARRNHSYRVVYYEPAGTDATIYDPAPDFRFQNDTGGYVLIQTKIEGDELIFEFWGQPDGRKVEQTKPRIFNITPPPPTKLVETEDLPVGEKKCTERPHSGADTEFTYTVTYPDSRVEQEVFKSHYVPWQEVCLIGVPKGTLQPAEGEAPVEPALPSADTQGQAGTLN